MNATTRRAQSRESVAAASARQVNDVEFLDREAALAILGVRRETLYTYVSRGLIRTVAQPGLKTKLYRRSDVEKLRTRSAPKPESLRVSHALRYGAPIAPTWITEITPQGPRYRGLLATDLARQGRSFEYAAELLWSGIPKLRIAPWPVTSLSSRAADWLDDDGVPRNRLSTLRQFATIAVRMSAMELAPSDAPSIDLLVARRLLQCYAGVAGRLGPSAVFTPIQRGESIARCVARGLGRDSDQDDRVVDVIDAALVLSADHEFSAPTFAARVCASTGADLPACVAAALMAQSGAMQIGGTSDVEALLELPSTSAAAARRRAATGETSSLPCFDHPLYDRDPRAATLLDLVRRFADPGDGAQRAFKLVDDAERRGQSPNLFAALVIASSVMNLPKGSGALFHTLGRTAGWIAHAVEQQLAGSMLRPRAKYMGPSA